MRSDERSPEKLFFDRSLLDRIVDAPLLCRSSCSGQEAYHEASPFEHEIRRKPEAALAFEKGLAVVQSLPPCYGANTTGSLLARLSAGRAHGGHANARTTGPQHGMNGSSGMRYADGPAQMLYGGWAVPT